MNLTTPSYIAVMGKRRGREPSPSQLEARAALAALLWWQTLPRPLVACVEAEMHGPGLPSGAEVARRLLVERGGVADGAVLARPWSNATVTEVRGHRVLLRERGLLGSEITAVTHPYHAARTARYFAEIGVAARVVSVTLAAAARIETPALPAARRAVLLALVARGVARPPDLWREVAVEMIATLLHRMDRRGRGERWLADWLRGRGR